MKHLTTFIFFSLVFLFFLRPMSPDGDVYHHLATGKYMFEHFRFPTTDEWTFTAHGKPWIAHSWGTATLMFIVFHQLGPRGLSLLFAAVGVTTMVLLYLLLKTYNVPRPLRFLTLALAVPLLALRWPTRPESFQFLFFAGLLLVERYRLLKPKAAFLFPIIILLWANMYGASVIFGMCLVLFFYASAIASSHFQFDRRSFFFGIIVIVSFASAFLNPYGMRAVLYPVLLRGIAPYQGEWAGLSDLVKIAPIEILITVQYHILLYGLYAAALLLLIALSVKPLFAYKNELLLSFAIFSPFIAFRFLPHAVILTIPAIGIALSENRIWMRRAIALLAVLLISLSLSLQLPVVGITQNPFPQDILSFLNQYSLSGKIFTNQRLGSFFEYSLAPKSTVYVDTRDDLYLPTGTIAEYVTTFSQKKSAIPMLTTYDVDIVVADPAGEGPAYRPLFYSPDWTLVYISDRFFVFVKNTVAKERHITCLCALDPFAPTYAKPGKEDDAIALYQQSLQDHPKALQTTLALATALLYKGKYTDALTALSSLHTETGPAGLLQDITTNLLKSRILIELQRCPDAARVLTSTEELTHYRLIFTPFTNIQTNISSLWSLYALRCKK